MRYCYIVTVMQSLELCTRNPCSTESENWFTINHKKRHGHISRHHAITLNCHLREPVQETYRRPFWALGYRECPCVVDAPWATPAQTIRGVRSATRLRISLWLDQAQQPPVHLNWHVNFFALIENMRWQDICIKFVWNMAMLHGSVMYIKFVQKETHFNNIEPEFYLFVLLLIKNVP